MPRLDYVECGPVCGVNCALCNVGLAKLETKVSKLFAICDVCSHPIEVGDFVVAAHGLYFCSTLCEEKYERGGTMEEGDLRDDRPLDVCPFCGADDCDWHCEESQPIVTSM